MRSPVWVGVRSVFTLGIDTIFSCGRRPKQLASSRSSSWRPSSYSAAALLLLTAAWLPAAPALASGAPGAPHLLPGDANAAASRVPQDRRTWLVGARPSHESARLARRFGAKRLLRGTGVYRVRRSSARPFAKALQAAGLYSFSEPNRRVRRRAFASEPLSRGQWALPAIGATQLTPPPVTAGSPTLGIVDDAIDIGHPEFRGAKIEVGSQRDGF